MTRVLMTVGPRGAGKSTFCQSIASSELSGVAYASRDDFLIEKYGDVAWNPHSDFMERGINIFLSRVAELSSRNRAVLLECFCSSMTEIKSIQDRITSKTDNPIIFEAIYFVTPHDICAEQYTEREYPNETGLYRSDIYNRAYKNSVSFHTKITCLYDYFQIVWDVNPRQLNIFKPEVILGLIQ